MSGTASAPEAHATITEQRGAPDGADSRFDGRADEPWRDPALSADDRVADLLKRMTLEEKLGQLASVWLGAAVSTDDLAPETDAEARDVAPHQHDMADETLDWNELIRSGLGQLTRPFGTAPVDPALGALALARLQAEIAASSRFGIPAIAHEECLTGFMTWGATVFPTPLAWGARSTRIWSRRWRATSGRPCGSSVSTRDSRRCST